MSEFVVVVCGGRDYDNRERLFGVLDKALQAATLAGRTFTLVHGGARGADALALLIFAHFLADYITQGNDNES